MGKYVDDGKADKEIGKMAEIVVEHMRKRIPSAKTIILIGGYGRGEGAIEMKEGKWEPINDFDFYIITDSVLGDNFLEEVALECSKLIGKGGIAHPEGFEERYDFNKFFHVDIRCLKESALQKLQPTIRYYEIPYSKAVWGDGTIEKFRKFSPKEIPLSEAIRILMNRMMLLIMCYDPQFVEKKGYMGDEEKKIMLYYIAKSYLSCAEALLLLSGDYKPNYIGRAEEFSRVFPRKFPELKKSLPDLDKKVTFFTNYKIRPKPEGLDALKEWEECRKAVGVVYRECIRKVLGKEFENWPEMADYCRAKLPNPYFLPYAGDFLKINNLPKNRIMEWFVSKGAQAFFNFKYAGKIFSATGKIPLGILSLNDAGVKIINATPLVLFSIDEECKEDKEMVEKAGKIISGIYPCTEIRNWAELKREYLKAYRLYYLQRFV